MKKGLIFVLFALVSIVSYSQISWNVKAGANVNMYTGDNNVDGKFGFYASAGMEYQFSKMFSVQPSLRFAQKGAKWTEQVVINEQRSILRVTSSPMYLELPILAAVRFSLTKKQKIVLKAGPYLAYGIGGKVTYKANGVTEKENVFGKDSGAERFEAGVEGGLSYEISKVSINLGVQYGLTKVYDGDDAPKNMTASIGLGYRF